MSDDGVDDGDASDWRFDLAHGIQDVPTFEAWVDGRPASRLDFWARVADES